MKNPTQINNSPLFLVSVFFGLIAVAVIMLLPKFIGAQSVENEAPADEALVDEQNQVASTTIANLIASSTALAEQVSAEASAAEKKLAEEEILKQIEALRGLIPDVILNSLEQKYQVGAYKPKSVSPVAVAVSSVSKTATTTGNVSFVFLKNLKQGDGGADVLALQKILNGDNDTRISKTGVGSPGNETDFFGALTKAAVIKFQNKHAAEILIPNGLVSGTGFVGLSTRVVLNTLAAGKGAPQINTQTRVLPKISYCEPVFPVVRGASGLTVSESASIGCVVATSKESCEKVDTYTQSAASLNADGIRDCRWISK
jgi:hypothetical protein